MAWSSLPNQLECVPLQLAERNKGNEHYRRSAFKEALKHYSNAAAIVELVRGCGLAEQAEVDVNCLTVYLNKAAAHLALQEFADAAIQCSKALGISSDNEKGLLRRAKAYIGMHEYEVWKDSNSFHLSATFVT